MNHRNPLKIALVQQRNEESRAKNLARTLDNIAAAANSGARLVCLQELFDTPYFCQVEDENFFGLAEPIPGPLTEALSDAAREHEVVIVAPFFERRAAGLYHNAAVLIDADGSLRGHYRKMHLPDDPQFYEKYYFTPGDLGFRAWDTAVGRIGVAICWDQWFPETARLLALDGAELIVLPTAIGWIDPDPEPVRAAQHRSWETVQRAHAIANGVFVAAPNRVGVETCATGQSITFWGQSFVADPAGEVVARASADKEEVLLADCDLSRIEAQRIAWPFLRDRRIDAYSGLLRRFGRTDPPSP